MEIKKPVQTINYLVRLANAPVDKMKIIKLIWLADRLHLRKYGRTIVGDTYYAMKHWPVASGILNICNKDVERIDEINIPYISEYIALNWHKLTSLRDTDLNQFSETDVEVLDEVHALFWSLSTHALVEITHKYPEWKKFEARIASGSLQNKMDYMDFFQNIPNQDTVFDTSEEHLESAKTVFQEDAQFCRFFA